MAVYLLHFANKLAHAQHYIGWAKSGNVKRRINRHLAGNGARILQVCNEKSITYELARVWPEGDKAFERRLKRCKKTSRFCPLCRGDRAMENMTPEKLGVCHRSTG